MSKQSTLFNFSQAKNTSQTGSQDSSTSTKFFVRMLKALNTNKSNMTQFVTTYKKYLKCSILLKTMF